MPEQIGSVWLDPKRISGNPVFYDIGANTGKVSHALLKKFGGICNAYEPGSVLKKIKVVKGLRIHSKAIWKRYGEVTFFDMPDQSCSSSIIERKPKRGKSIQRHVECVTLSLALRRYSWIDFVSIDIEGGEWELLNDIQIKNLQKVDQICIEFHTEFSGGLSLDYMMERLERLAWFNCKIVEGEGTTRPIVWGCKKHMSPRKPFNQWIKKTLEGRHFEKVLNLGCGNDRDQEGGVYSRDYFDADEVVCCDIDRESIASVIANSESLPFEDGSFDFVFANWMIYKTNVRETLGEVVRVLKPGGHLLVSHGHGDKQYIKSITETVASVLHEPVEIKEMDYVAKGSVRKAGGVFGSVDHERLEIEYFNCIIPPVLVVVAHWDDEVISLGGLLSEHKGEGFVVVSVTHRDQEPTYREVFKGIGKDLGFKAITLDHRQRARPIGADEDRHDYTRAVKRVPLDPKRIYELLLKQVGDLSIFKTVVTHGGTGDYGNHPQHAEVSKIIRDVFRELPAVVWGFNMKVGTQQFHLDKDVAKAKLKLIQRYKPSFKRSNVGVNEYLNQMR